MIFGLNFAYILGGVGNFIGMRQKGSAEDSEFALLVMKVRNDEILSEIMNVLLKMMKFALKMMNISLKMMNFALKMMNFVSEIMNFSLKMMNFA